MENEIIQIWFCFGVSPIKHRRTQQVVMCDVWWRHRKLSDEKRISTVSNQNRKRNKVEEQKRIREKEKARERERERETSIHLKIECHPNHSTKQKCYTPAVTYCHRTPPFSSNINPFIHFSPPPPLLILLYTSVLWQLMVSPPVSGCKRFDGMGCGPFIIPPRKKKHNPGYRINSSDKNKNNNNNNRKPFFFKRISLLL